MASGDFNQYIQGAAQQSGAELLRGLFPDVSVAAKALRIDRFNTLNGIVLTNSAVRSREFKWYPALAFKIANVDDSVALLGVAQCALMCDSMSNQFRRALHQEINALFQVGSSFGAKLWRLLNMSGSERKVQWQSSQQNHILLKHLDLKEKDCMPASMQTQGPQQITARRIYQVAAEGAK